MNMLHRMRHHAFMLAVFGLIIGFSLINASDAFAQAGGSAAQNFSCSSNGSSSGKIYNVNASCPTTLTFENIFSYFICNMEQLSSNLMGSMYCGMVVSLTPMVMAVMTFAVLVFGFGFTIGVIPATAREFQKFMLKVSFILVFATQSEFLIGYGYRFLVEGAREGVAIALSGLYVPPANAPASTGNSAADIYAHLDGFLGRTMHFATDYVGAKWDGNETSNPCQNAIFAVLAIMAVAFPPIFYLALLIIFRVTLTFLRAVFGYVYAIVGITFLLTLAPFFLSFYMFQATRSYFDKWLGYLVSFALQMVVIFAFLTFVVSIDVKNLSSGLVQIIKPVQETQETTSFRLPWKYCTLCDFEVIDKEGKVIPDDTYKDYLGEGTLRCKANPNYNPNATNPGDRRNYTTISVLNAVTPQPGQAVPDERVQNALLKFAATALLSLLVLAYMIEGVLRFLPYFAQKISGGLATYSPQLGGGSSPSGVATVDIPGLRYDAQSQSYQGVLGSFERGFDGGFSRTRDEKGNPVSGDSLSRTARGLKDGFSTMVYGGRGKDGGGTQADPGLIGGMVRWLANPLGGGRD